MGFWQGVNEGLTYSLDKRAREKEIAEAKEERKAEREETRAFQRDMFREQLLESRRDRLFEVWGERKKSSSEASQYVAKTQSLVSRFEGMESDPRVSALTQNPVAAAALEDQLREVERKRAEDDLDLPPLSGTALLDMITTQTVEGFAPVEISVEDILGMDVSDRGAYERTMIDLSAKPPVPDVRLAPEAYRRMNPETLKEGRALFDQEVLRAANQALKAVANIPNASASLSKLLNDAGKENSPGMIALRDMFGVQAIASMQKTDSPYIQNFNQDPQLKPYVLAFQQAQQAQRLSAEERTLLEAIVNDPQSSESDRTRAKNLLDRF
jgi:hypothetical protein